MTNQTYKSSDYIYTQSGRRFLPDSLKAHDLCLEDIAYGLSRIFRFNGQSTISVLRHSIGLAACFASPHEKYFALFHDSTEAYLMDVPVPLKWYMHSNWHEDYQRIEGLIFEKFGVPHDRITQLNVHGMDKRVIEYEMEANNTSMKYPDSKNMPPSIKEELRQSYRWDLQDSYLPLEWLAQVQQIAREAGYFVPPLALE